MNTLNLSDFDERIENNKFSHLFRVDNLFSVSKIVFLRM